MLPMLKNNFLFVFKNKKVRGKRIIAELWKKIDENNIAKPLFFLPVHNNTRPKHAIDVETNDLNTYSIW